MFILIGNISVFFLYPGCLIEMNFRQPQSSDIKYFSRMLVTQVSHHVEAKGNYHCNFEAIPSDTEHIPQPSYVMPIAQPQIATVTDNKDSHGRVKVKFDWQANGDTTDFIRVMSPDAGSSEKVGKNRGLVTIPEIKDQVMVGFQLNHPDRPYVMGGLFHGKIGGGGGGGNNVKSFSTKSGHSLSMNDGGGISLVDKSKLNHIVVDGDSSITITAASNITLTNGKSTISLIDGKISITASESVDIQAPVITVGSFGGEKPTTTLDVKGQTITVEGETKIDCMAPTMNIGDGKTTQIKIESQSKIEASSGGQVVIAGAEVQINKK